MVAFRSVGRSSVLAVLGGRRREKGDGRKSAEMMKIHNIKVCPGDDDDDDADRPRLEQK